MRHFDVLDYPLIDLFQFEAIYKERVKQFSNFK